MRKETSMLVLWNCAETCSRFLLVVCRQMVVQTYALALLLIVAGLCSQAQVFVILSRRIWYRAHVLLSTCAL